ncbi:MAG: lipopolysaccharide biosynthesis protein [Saprospiraceae bacterium]
MGIIQRQSIKQSIVTYIAVLVGAINILVIYPTMLTEEEFGLVQFVLKTAEMITPFVLLGTGHIAVKFFPEFQDKTQKHHGFLSLLLMIVLIGQILFLLISLTFQESILDYFLREHESELYVTFVFYILPLVILIGLNQVISRYIVNFNRIVIPQIFNNLFLKLGLLTLCLTYFYDFIDFVLLMRGLIVVYLLILIALLIYLKTLGHLSLRFNFNFLTKDRIKRIADYAGFSILAGFGSMLAFRIDFFMVGMLVDLSSVAVYAIAFFIADAIDIPRKAIESISAPIISQAWQRNDIAHIEELYKKSSINLLIVGLFFLIGIWSCIDHLFDMIPNNEKYAQGKYIVLILGMARIVDMVTGINAQIIALSKYYRFTFYAMLALAVINVFTNFLLIPPFKIYGAAFATLTSLILFNFLKLGFIYKKIKIQPLSLKTLAVFGIGISVYLLTLLLPNVGHPLLNILIKAVFITVTYGSMILYFNISQDITNIVNKFLKKGNKV